MEDLGRASPSPLYKEERETYMYTVSDILRDIDRGCTANNMIEDCFSYRIVFYVNENGIGKKYHVDTPYGNLRWSLENIIRENLSTTNCLVLAAVTTRKNRETVSLLSRSYAFSLNEYFQKVCNEKEKGYISNNCGRRRANWCYQ